MFDIDIDDVYDEDDGRCCMGILLCKICSQKLNFWREFITAGRQGKCFIFSIWISICRKRTCNNFENRSKTNVFMSKMNFE